VLAGRTKIEEVLAMSETMPSSRVSVPISQLRPLAVRLSDDLRAQLDIIAQLRDRSVTEEIRVALESWVTQARSDPKLQAVADEARRQIEAEAERRRNAIGSIFSDPTPPATRPGKSTPSGRSTTAAEPTSPTKA
jgi:predicted transcriptional regulator